jgi:hypothetical protein
VYPVPRTGASGSTGTSTGAGANAANSLPSYQDVAASSAQMPDLTLNLHSWSKTTTERYIFLNMVKLHEGEANPQGVRVVSITEDGAVLSWQGREFTLQR